VQKLKIVILEDFIEFETINEKLIKNQKRFSLKLINEPFVAFTEIWKD